jgi:transketolase
VTTPESPFRIGKAEQLAWRDETHGKRVGIVVTGTLAHNALVAAKELNEQHGIGASVLHLATIKPLDTEVLLRFAEEHGVLVTVEEHQVAGGLGSAVAEYLSEVRPTKIARIGVRDQFGQSGEPDELIAHYGMDTAAIVRAARGIAA